MILMWFAFDMWGATRSGGGIAYFAHLGGFAAGFGLAVLMLERNWIEMERYEKSLLQIWRERKKPVQEEFGQSYGMLRNELKDEKLEPGAAIYNKQQMSETEPKTITLEPEKAKEEFIRFTCLCGKRVKVSVEYASRMGRCPRCKKRVRIPEKP